MLAWPIGRKKSDHTGWSYQGSYFGVVVRKILISLLGIALTGAILWVIGTSAGAFLAGVHGISPSFWMKGAVEVLLKVFAIVTTLLLYRVWRLSGDVHLWLTGALMLQHLASVIHYAVNAPIGDDFLVLLPYATEPTAAGLFEPYNGSLLVVNKLLAVVLAGLGSLNFVALILISNLAIISCIFMLTPRAELRLVLALLLLNFGYYNVTIWGSSVCNALVVTFAIAAFHFAKEQKAAAATFLALLSALTFGNGLFTPLLIIPLLRKKLVALLSALGVILLFALTSDNGPLGLHPPLDHLRFVCMFLGSFFQFGYTSYLPFIAGIAILMVALIIVLQRPYTPLTALVLLLLLSAGAAAQFRLPQGIGTALANHYIFYSVLMVGAVVIFLHEKRSMRLLVPAAAYCLLASFMFTGEIAIRKKQLIDYRDRIVSGEPTIHHSTNFPANADSIAIIAMERGIWP